MFTEIKLELKGKDTLGFSYYYSIVTDTLTIYCEDRKTNLELGLTHEITEFSLHKLLSKQKIFIGLESYSEQINTILHVCTLISLPKYKQVKSSVEYFKTEGYEKLF